MSHFVTFLRNVFRLHSKHPIHTSHGVVVDFQFACGLGKVGRLVKYKAIALEVLRESKSFDEATKRNSLGGEDSSTLREVQERHPHTVHLSVVFRNPETCFAVCVPHSFERKPDERFDDPVQRCDKLAAEHFCAMQRFQFPDITSPDLG